MIKSIIYFLNLSYYPYRMNNGIAVIRPKSNCSIILQLFTCIPQTYKNSRLYTRKTNLKSGSRDLRKT